jgi:hypothetical protein
VEKEAEKFCLLAQFLPQVSNSPAGQNSANLVTLLLSDRWTRSSSKYEKC